MLGRMRKRMRYRKYVYVLLCGKNPQLTSYIFKPSDDFMYSLILWLLTRNLHRNCAVTRAALFTSVDSAIF